MRLKRIILSDVIFVSILLLLVGFSIFSYHRINYLNTRADWVNHTNLIKLKLEQTLSYIKDAETGQRNFLLTEDNSYLLPYFTGLKNYHQNLTQLNTLTKDNITQQNNLKKLESLAASRIKRLDSVALALKKNPVSIANLLSDGKTMMEDIRLLVAAMIAIENKLLAERISEKNYAAQITPFYSILLSIFVLIIFAFGYYILRSEKQLRFDAQHNIKKLHDYFKDLPAVFAIVRGTEHVHELTNTLYNEMSGNRVLNRKPLRTAFPELAGNGFYEHLDEVYRSGKLFIGKEMPISVAKNAGEPVISYFNFIFKPLLNKQNQADGILIFGYEITEMIAARNKVEETEQRSRLAIEAGNIGTFDWDMEHSHFISSDRLLEIFGFNADDRAVKHQSMIDRFHPVDKPIRDKAVEESYSKGRLSYEARIIWPDKSVHCISVYGKILYSNDKQTLRMYGTVIDTTTQKTVLEELKESEAKFRLLADSMPQFVWTSDEHGNLDYFNKAVFDYSGLTAADIQREGWMSIVHPDDREENARKWREAVASGEEFIFEHRFKNFSNEYTWQLSRALPQRDRSGHIQTWVGTSTDIQDQKNLSQKLELQISERTQELNDLNKHLLIKNSIYTQAEEIALIGSYSWNLSTGELEYSDNLFRLFGYEPNEFVPSFEKYHSMIHPEDKDQVMKDGMETMRTKKLAANTYRIITKNGKIKYFRSTGKIFTEHENELLIGTVQDISQDTMLNEILRIKNLQLERNNTELESFNYIASHDLQEPLRKIQSFSQRILQTESNNFSELSKDYFLRINTSAARMQELINALLNYSKTDSKLKNATSIDLNSTIENVRADLQETIDEKNAIIEYPVLPTINAVSIQVHQLFINIISNAIKYSKKEIAPHIKILAAVVNGSEINDAAADKRKTYWKITVIDNGIGFEQEYESKIFELFQRLHSNNDYTGTGIGLAICKKIILNHQGFIAATGKPGVGSTFTVYFPFLS